MKLVPQSFSFEHEIDGEEILKRIESAGRSCYQSSWKITETSASKFVAMILKRGHDSVVEHVSVGVRIVCSRGISHEIVRHRIGVAYSQESTRFCSYNKDRFGNEITCIDDRPWIEEPVARVAWEVALQDAERAYFAMLTAGSKAEIARQVLPNALKTEIVATFTLRAWRHFFKLRCAPAAHPQMRSLAKSMLKEFAEKIPVVFDDLKEEFLDEDVDG